MKQDPKAGIKTMLLAIAILIFCFVFQPQGIIVLRIMGVISCVSAVAVIVTSVVLVIYCSVFENYGQKEHNHDNTPCLDDSIHQQPHYPTHIADVEIPLIITPERAGTDESVRIALLLTDSSNKHQERAENKERADNK